MVRGRRNVRQRRACRATRSNNRDSSPNDSETNTVVNAAAENDRQTDVQGILRLLQNMSGRELQRVIRGLGDLCRNPGPAVTPAPAANKIRRPATLQIPKYEDKPPGTEGFISVELFLRTVRRETRVGDYDDSDRIMIARDHILGHARVKFDNHNLIEEPSWARFEERMKEVFAIPPAEIRQKLHSLMFFHKTGEQLAQFVERLSSELNNYDPDGDMDDEEKLPHLKRILRIALPQEMRYPLNAARTCRALTEAIIDYADGQTQIRLTVADIEKEKEEMGSTGERKSQTSTVAAAGVSRFSHTSRNDIGEEEGSRETQGYSSRGRHQRTRGRGTGRGRGGVRHPRCNGCGGNHVRATCTRSLNAVCYNCGIMGHLAVVCRKNARGAADPFSAATRNVGATAPPQQSWAAAPRYPPHTHRPWAPPQPLAAPQQRPIAPPLRQAAPAPAVAAAPLQWAIPGPFPWQQQQQQQPALPPTEEQEQQ